MVSAVVSDVRWYLVYRLPKWIQQPFNCYQMNFFWQAKSLQTHLRHMYVNKSIKRFSLATPMPEKIEMEREEAMNQLTSR